MKSEKCYCSFCGKTQDDVVLICGPSAFICNECIVLCGEKLTDTGVETPESFSLLGDMNQAISDATKKGSKKLREKVTFLEEQVERFEKKVNAMKQIIDN